MGNEWGQREQSQAGQKVLLLALRVGEQGKRFWAEGLGWLEF